MAAVKSLTILYHTTVFNWASARQIVRPAKAQISLRWCAGWSEPLLIACVVYRQRDIQRGGGGGGGAGWGWWMRTLAILGGWTGGFESLLVTQVYYRFCCALANFYLSWDHYFSWYHWAYSAVVENRTPLKVVLWDVRRPVNNYAVLCRVSMNRVPRATFINLIILFVCVCFFFFFFFFFFPSCCFFLLLLFHLVFFALSSNTDPTFLMVTKVLYR